MAKVNFSARKDPLLRPRPPAARKPDAAVEPLTAAGRTRPAKPAAEAQRSHDPPSIEEPTGVISIAARGAPAVARTPAREQPAPASGDPAAAHPRSGHSRRVARRVQTSFSLPPEVWETLDELAAGASVTTGKLLTAILTAAIPDSAAGAFATVERLLLSATPDEGLQEERNYRLALELRTRLDALATTVGSGPRLKRSLLIHAIIAAHAPADAEQARELITTQRIDELRAAMLESAAD